MTAPVAPAAVAQAPVVTTPAVETQPAVTPVVETQKSDDKPESMQSIMDRITRKVTPEAVAEPAEVVSVPDEQAAALQATADTTQPLSTAETIAETLPQATPQASNLTQEIAADDDPDGRVTLRARGEDGRYTDMDQSKKYELSIIDWNKKEKRVVEATLPEMMKLAKQGLKAQEAQAELQHHRTRAPQIVQENQELTKKVEQLQTTVHQLLTADEPWVVQQREAYAQQFTPEARVKMLEQELIRARNGGQQQPIAQPAQQQMPPEVQRQIQAFGAAIAPITAEVEGLVGVDAARGRLIGALSPIMVNGQIPPERLQEVQQYIQGPYRAWAQQEASKQKTAQQELEAARQERVRAQQAARSVGTATRPTGGMSSTAPAPQPKPRTVQDAINKAISRPVASAPG